MSKRTLLYRYIVVPPELGRVLPPGAESKNGACDGGSGRGGMARPDWPNLPEQPEQMELWDALNYKLPPAPNRGPIQQLHLKWTATTLPFIEAPECPVSPRRFLGTTCSWGQTLDVVTLDDPAAVTYARC